MALDIFDGVEMLDVIIEENEFSHGVPKSFEKAMLAFVCISFLLSPLHLVEIKITGSGRWKIRRWLAGLRTTLQIVCVNCVFLGSACIYGGGTRKMHPFLLLKMLSSFALVSLRYVQSVKVVVVTISKLDFK